MMLSVIMPFKIRKQKKNREKFEVKNIKAGVVNVVRKIFLMLASLIRKINIKKIKLGGSNVKISKEGKSIILCMLIAFLISFIVFGFNSFTTILLFLLLVVVYFFRDPDRVLPERNNIVVSPCDGLILNIETSSLPEELGGKDANEYTKISVFMNVTDVHVQRMPVSCKVKQIEYIKGVCINASFDKASKDNERNIVLVERENGDNLCIVQIAGFIARRIVCNASKDEVFKIGERYGMIKFGSRIELYMPKSYKVEVLKGQRVVCGETVVGSF